MVNLKFFCLYCFVFVTNISSFDTQNILKLYKTDYL